MGLRLEQQLYLMLAGGLPGEAIARASRLETALDGGRDWDRPEALKTLQRIALQAAAERGRRVEVHWPAPEEAARLAARLRRAAVKLLWRDEASYPPRLLRRLTAPPAWVWLAGSAARLVAVSCAVVGSRRTPERLLAAAGALGRALAEAGVCVVSGLAEGADAAAHAGAAQGRAGTVAIPARGVLNVDLTGTRGKGGRWTVLALGRPDEPFSAGLAVRRNALIAALGEGVVLVASDLRGGSSHAVRWALAHGTPLWCFEAGRATPPGNRSLLRAGLARPLPLGDAPERWVAKMLPALSAYAAKPAPAHKQECYQQLDWWTTVG